MLERLRSHRKLGVASGFLLLVIGFILALPFVPGPGIPLMVLGLVILSGHLGWAKRLLQWANRKLDWPAGSYLAGLAQDGHSGPKGTQERAGEWRTENCSGKQ